ncbi:CFL [Mytilus coruscus]|uniref:CFL n=1 Tax=Mytilus coruscus TaxID=42192 RepID=A0A6J8AZ84_MYTCO|nr:CFL [Mytilus coruscus]
MYRDEERSDNEVESFLIRRELQAFVLLYIKMAMSGVGLGDSVVTTYDTKLKTKHLLDALVLKINKEEKRQIVTEQEFECGTLPFEELKKFLPPKEPRYVLYDYNYTTENGQKHSKIILVSWSPDDAPMKEKMIYASSKDAVKKKLQAIKIEVQANDLGDLDEADIEAKLKKI